MSLPEPPKGCRKGCSSLPTLRVGGGGIPGARCSGPRRPGTLLHIPAWEPCTSQTWLHGCRSPGSYRPWYLPRSPAPQPRPGRRVREASSPPTYYAWMQTGRAYSVFPSGRSRLQAGPRRRLPTPRGCPARLRSHAARPGTLRAGLRKHC